MTASIIITICSLLLLAYLFDISSAKIKVPSVILLLALGWGVKQVIDFLGIGLPDLDSILPILGTLGLILIVLEGSLELELSRKRLPLIGKSFTVAFLSIVIFSIGLAYAFQYFTNVPFKTGLINAIPLAIISSAIAIPSVQSFMAKNKEFVTYESSLSDILGVLLFNFIILNKTIEAISFGVFFLEILVTLIITLICTFGLLYFLNKTKHHVKYVPIILIIILVYQIEEVYHLPSLIFILLFGLFLANVDKLEKRFSLKYLEPKMLKEEVIKFRELTVEIAFLIRSLFFLLFGFLVETSELLNTSTIIWSLLICGGIYFLRFILLIIFKIPIRPLLFIAPRGLITILLFLSIPVSQRVGIANKSLVIQVIIITALVMMIGMITRKPIDQKEDQQISDTEE